MISVGEKKLLLWVENHVGILFFVIVSAISLLIRLAGANYISDDMQSFLIPWYGQIKTGGGLFALDIQVGNYNLLYQTIISLLTYIDFKEVYLYKIVSVVFDYILAFTAARYLCKLCNKGHVFFNTVYAVLLFLPTVVLNSAFWGQCDVMYTSMVLLFLFDLYSEKYLRSFIWFGLAFAFKLQAVFILPFAICYYFYKKRFSIGYFIFSLAVFWLSGLIAYFFGRDLLSPLKIYFAQANYYPKMYLNSTSFWRLLGDDYGAFGGFAILITIIICGIGVYAIMAYKIRINTLEHFFGIATWFVWTCVLFLPAMHERYTFLLDILLVILAFILPRYIKYACLSVLLSLYTYGNYLCGIGTLNIIFVFLYIFSFAYYTYEIFIKRTILLQKNALNRERKNS